MARPPALHTIHNNPKPILVTVYRLKPKLQVVQQYYQFVFGPRDETYKVDDCPGCGKALKNNANEHKCNGSKLPHPVNTRPNQPQPDPEEVFKQYLGTLTHKVILSD
jgi:hypothetical protein